MRGFYYPMQAGFGGRNQPSKVTELVHRERYYEPANNPAEDGYTRISAADQSTGIRQPVEGTPAPRFPLHED